MKLFNKKKEKELKNDDSLVEKKANDKVTEGSNNSNIIVKILGSGCAKCNQLEKVTKEALSELGINYTIEHVTDFSKIANYGVMSTPALVVDEKVISYGKVLKKDEVIKLLKVNLK